MKTLEQQIKCAKRELAMRKKVYPYRLSLGKMKADDVRHEIESMEAIIATLESLPLTQTPTTNPLNGLL